MMMECPRCGFAQPKDQFCANCGLDVEHFVAQPKPFLIRLLQNPNLHLSLIGLAVIGVIGYIIYSQSTLVSRQIGNLLDLPLSSRDAADPSELPAPRPLRPESASSALSGTANDDDEGAVKSTSALASNSTRESAVDTDSKKVAPADAIKLTTGNKLEVTHWEVPREALANLIALAEKLGESNGGRIYLYPLGGKIHEQIQSVGQRMSLGRNIGLQTGAQLSIETPPTTTEAFQYGLFFQLAKVDNKELSLKWESTLVLPQHETAAESASNSPAVRATVESVLNGATTLYSTSLLLIVMEPSNRSPREDLLARAGEGPWAIFASPEFRAGMTDWAITVQIR